jgi:hypothetical protein
MRRVGAPSRLRTRQGMKKFSFGGLTSMTRPTPRNRSRCRQISTEAVDNFWITQA